MGREVTISLSGVPQAKGRARSFAYTSKKTGKMAVGHYTPENTRSYEGMIRSAATDAMDGMRPLEGPVEFSLTMVFPVPASWSEKKRALALAGDVLPAKKPDADNVVKAWTDACNGVVFGDDAQIVRGSFHKVYGKVPGAAALVKELQR